MQWIGYDRCIPKIVQLLLQELNHLIHGKFQCKAIYTPCCGILWSIWITRNKLVFDIVDPDWDTVCDLNFPSFSSMISS